MLLPWSYLTDLFKAQGQKIGCQGSLKAYVQHCLDRHNDHYKEKERKVDEEKEQEIIHELEKLRLQTELRQVGGGGDTTRHCTTRNGHLDKT